MGPQSRAVEGGGKAFRLGQFVQPLLVEQNVDDFDARPALADLQAKKRATAAWRNSMSISTIGVASQGAVKLADSA